MDNWTSGNESKDDVNKDQMKASPQSLLLKMDCSTNLVATFQSQARQLKSLKLEVDTLSDTHPPPPDCTTKATLTSPSVTHKQKVKIFFNWTFLMTICNPEEAHENHKYSGIKNLSSRENFFPDTPSDSKSFHCYLESFLH